jgi:hypothetical protein
VRVGCAMFVLSIQNGASVRLSIVAEHVNRAKARFNGAGNIQKPITPQTCHVSVYACTYSQMDSPRNLDECLIGPFSLRSSKLTLGYVTCSPKHIDLHFHLPNNRLRKRYLRNVCHYSLCTWPVYNSVARSVLCSLAVLSDT